MGKNALFNSLKLVTFLVDLEQAVNEQFDTIITLMDEKAFSRSQSPFRTIGTLADYIIEITNEDGK